MENSQFKNKVDYLELIAGIVTNLITNKNKAKRGEDLEKMNK